MDAKLAQLRSLMQQHDLHAYIVPSEDAHQSEYIADCDGRRAFVSGFTGSAGLAVVTLDAAALWTDGRYFLQASQQLTSDWILQKSGLPNVPSKEDWLIKVLPPSSRVGIDPTLLTFPAARTLEESLTKAGHSLVFLHNNLIDAVWGSDRPARQLTKVFQLSEEFTGTSATAKIQQVRDKLANKAIWGFVVTTLDEVAWLFNLRGADIAYNPVFFAYALVTIDNVLLYMDTTRLDDQARISLETKSYVQVRPYLDIFSDLPVLAEKYSDKKLWVDPRCSQALLDVLTKAPALSAKSLSSLIEESRSPIQVLKSIKNDAEIQGFRNSHLRDATALCEYFAWLEEELVVKGNTSISEVDAADKLEYLRSQLDKFVGLSFDTISAIGANGSIIHYKPHKETCATISATQLYLCDSGAQFLDGTTDVTRTMHFGTPTDAEREAFTRVLKGHIQIDMTVFPRGTTGYLLDVISRLSLWKGGMDFRHGTGHGVGSFLNVHEGPHGIGTRIAYNDVPLEKGMTITNEPGFYEDGQFGIRIENVMIVREVTDDSVKRNFGGRGYLGFEHVTLVPIQTKMVKVELLTPDERAWLNAYHEECLKELTPLMDPSSKGYAWLQRETRPI